MAAPLHATLSRCLPWRRAAVRMGEGEKEGVGSVIREVCSGQCEATQLLATQCKCLP